MSVFAGTVRSRDWFSPHKEEPHMSSLLSYVPPWFLRWTNGIGEWVIGTTPMRFKGPS